MASSELTTALSRFLDSAALQRKPLVSVESVPDPRVPGRTAHVVTALRCEDVQAKIEHLIAEAEHAPYGGRALFIGPHRLLSGEFRAIGEVILRRPAEAAA